MRRIISRTFIALAVLMAAVPGGAWELVTCTTDYTEAWAAFASQLKTAKPGSSRYLPYPFPATADEVLGDFFYQHERAWSDTSVRDLPPDEQSLFAALEQGHLRHEVLRVANWTPLRCGPERPREFYYVLRLFDDKTGEELTRAALDHSGLLSNLIHKPLGGSWGAHNGISTLEAVTAGVRSAYGVTAEKPQYVATWGTLRCDELVPCVAMRQGEHAYIAKGDDLYRIDEQVDRLSFLHDLAGDRKQVVLKRAEEQGALVVSLGGDQATLARPVAP